MKKILLILLLMLSCGKGKKYHDSKNELAIDSEVEQEILDFQKQLNQTFENPKTSPLPDRFRKDFEGLDFFPADTTYRIVAKFERTPDAEPFFMPTTTKEKTEEVVYGIASFELNGVSHQLEIYQTPSLLSQEKYKDYLFLPFLDETNGEETYGGGRYLDLTIPEGDSIIIDFNKAYNPYCVYNKKYSCPLVPRQNYLRTKVRAGVKNFTKD
ncbi:DUF1684 domain-containing protein [Flagellimonas allohymeniacidonis]|uniref:DUF1684 domain-containing protein n=1 Tax=Flagellimonas allohymeniacidonis TaxID=2517819 RepID=A0A4Q8QMC7_9FLAO|nr:DUF1684 domain-containing protein [Allomuricauda hymeniacidonis]TAI49456.1 DUF1684 domain-containing protein [Allomuricauda hymeniacidonis]